MNIFPLFIGGIEEEGEDTEADHYLVCVFRLVAEVDDDVHEENGGEIPEGAVQWFAKRILMLKE